MSQSLGQKGRPSVAKHITFGCQRRQSVCANIRTQHLTNIAYSLVPECVVGNVKVCDRVIGFENFTQDMNAAVAHFVV
jgi:hypothetical protein